MAKLGRIHFAGMGNTSARFNPLTLDFRDVNKQPAHSVLWLRNGGGKTTMLSLFYSVILPAKREWLGKFHDKPTQLSQYMFDREVGYILIEFFFADGTRRIIGQSLVKRAADEVSRICFTVRSDGPVALESLPVVGLAPSPAKTRELFFDYLDAENRKNPREVDLVKFDLAHGLGDWERHLIAIGVDPAVYRSHLVMNSDEGGLGEFFNFKTSDKFVEKLLEMADDPTVLPDDASGTDQVEAVVDKFRAKVLGMPDLEKEARFCQILSDGMKQYRLALDAAAKAARALQEARAVAAKAQRSVKETIQESERKYDSLDLLRKKQLSDQTEADSVISTHGRYRQAYERVGIQLRFDEAESAQRTARVADSTARAELATLQAAEKLREMEHWVGEVRAKKTALDELLANRRPEIAAVENLGTTLWKKIDALVATILTDSEGLRTKLAHNLVELGELRTKLATERKTQGEFTTALASVTQNLRNYERERRALRESSIIGEAEEPSAASERWLTAERQIDQQIEEARAESSQLRTRALEYRKEAKKLADLAAKEHRDAEVPRAQLRQATTTEAELRTSRVIQKHGGSVADLHNPGLFQAIQAEVDSLTSQILSRAVNRAADERILSRHSPPERPVFPVSVSIERVLDLLRTKGVRSAVPRYEWIAANCGLGEAEKLLKTNPATAAGILLQNPAELSLVTEIPNSDGIDAPVAITVLADDLVKPTIAHVIIPAERGYFNSEAAESNRGLVQERVNGSKQDQERLNSERREVDRAGNSLHDFTIKFAPDVVRRLTDEVTRREEAALAFTSRSSEAEALAASHEERASGLTEKISQLHPVKNEHGQKRLQVEKYITDFHNRVEGWRTSEREATEGLKKTEIAINALTSRTDEIGREDITSNEHLLVLRGHLVLAQARRDKIPEQYRSGKPQITDLEIDAIESEFELKRALLDRVLSESGLPEGIKTAEHARGRAEATYRTFVRDQNLRESDVSAARELHPDIKTAIAEQETAKEGAHQTLILSQQEFGFAKQARDALTPLLRDQRSTMHPEWAAPTTRAQADEYADRCRLIVDEAQAKKEAAAREQERFKEEMAKNKELLGSLRPWTGLLERLTLDIVATEPHPQFVPDPATLGKFLEGIRDEAEAQVRNHAESARRAETMFEEKIQSVLREPEFANARMESRNRLLELAAVRQQFDHQIEAIIADVSGRIQVIAHSRASLDAERELVMKAMERRGAASTTLLRGAQNLSVMPPEIPAWAGHCFMKFSVPEKRDEAERKSYLRRLLDYWITTNVAIPSGHIMAFECLLALVGSLDGSGKPQPKGVIGVEILKPEANLRFYYHDILVMRTFSGGELVTAAIILYCVMARLRAKRRGADVVSLGKDSGFLLLDNPVGKANLPDFLDLQIRIADIVGVQYICGTGINDIEALGAFPKVIRLRNSTISRSGAYVVKLDREVYNPVTAVSVAAKTPVLAKKGATA